MISRTLLMLVSLIFGISASVASYYFLFTFPDLSLAFQTEPMKLLYGVGQALLEGIKYAHSVGFEHVFGPPLALAFIGMVLGIRWMIFYVAGGALAALSIPILIGQAEAWKFQLPNPEFTVMYLSVGAIGGFVYWFVGGRAAGHYAPKLKKKAKSV